MENPSLVDVIKEACSIDPIFYINGFGYTYDPRRQPFTKLPFILYPFQQTCILEIIQSIGTEDLLIKKSRDMGASWLCVLAFEWLWHYWKRLSFLMVSRVEDYVDSSENPKSLFWKMDFFHDNLPYWLMPNGYDRNKHRTKMHILNPETRSVIDGESTTGQVARGDRRTAILLDEFAAVKGGGSVNTSTARATNSRIYNSTPLGTGNAYFDIHETKIKKLILHWPDHPVKRIGLYTTDENGLLRILDNEGYPKDYKPILDGKLRSIAYDYDCTRLSEREMAQEWDIDFGGSGYQYFKAALVQDSIRRFARPPTFIGELEYDMTTGDPIRFREDQSGHLRFWFLLDVNEKPPKEHPYIAGVDISAGTGNSNSALCLYDSVTHEKLLEYANPYIRPEEFAKQSVAICRWMGGPGAGNPKIIWESNGPGRQFGSQIMDLRYGNIYYRQRIESIGRKTSEIPGWASTRDTKSVLLGGYRDGIENGKCCNRSKEALEECLEYIFDPVAGVCHARENSKTDPTGAKSNHGDRVIADALAWYLIGEGTSKPKPEEPKIPIGSLAWRLKMREADKPRPGRELLASEGW